MASLQANGSRSQAPTFPDPIPGILPFGTVSIFAGSSGSGKTTMLAEWCARMQHGRTICGHPTQAPTGIYYLAADRRWAQDHAIWFQRANTRAVEVYSIADDEQVPSNLRDASKALELFEYCLNKLAPIPGSLVIVDPLTPLFINGDPNQQRPVAMTLLELNRHCSRRSLTMLVTAYHSKMRNDKRGRYYRAIDRIAGSGTFAGYSHTQMYITEPELPDQPWFAFGWRPRHSEEQQFRFIRDKQTGLLVPFTAPADPRIDAVLGLFPKDGLLISFTELWDQVQAAGVIISRETLFRLLKGMVAGCQVQRAGRGHYRRIMVS